MTKTLQNAKFKKYSWENGSFTISENMSDLIDALKEKPASLAPVVKKHAFAIAAEAAKGAPVDTGLLKNTLAGGVEAVDPNNYTVSDGTDYGIFQELGTGVVSAKHFLGGAAEREADPFFDEIRKVLSE